MLLYVFKTQHAHTCARTKYFTHKNKHPANKLTMFVKRVEIELQIVGSKHFLSASIRMPTRAFKRMK